MATHRVRAYLRFTATAASSARGRLQGNVRPNLARAINAGAVNEETPAAVMGADNTYHLDLPFVDNELEAMRTYDAVLAEVLLPGVLLSGGMEAVSWVDLHVCTQQQGLPCVAPFMRWEQPMSSVLPGVL